MPEQTVEHKRIFLALWPDEATRAQLYAHQQKIKCDPALHAALLQSRAVKPDNLHMTLHFIGSVSSEVLQNLNSALDLVHANAFDMEVDTTGYFPRPRVLWLGVSQMPPALPALVQQTAACVQQCVEAYELQSFQAHITLFRKVRNPGELVQLPAIHWPVNSFALVESKTLPEGVQYEVLRSWPLAPLLF
ncbi:MAG: RNA 2',3'-cyclic phosphodiesterase [Gammaproteobacteria bacterium]|nr:RNA 2',3'-cyclic phosphodiesterase [Gammaproteobacteria bacterium]